MLSKSKLNKLQDLIFLYESTNGQKVQFETKEKEIKEKIESFVRREKIDNIQIMSPTGQKFSVSILTGTKEKFDSNKVKNNWFLKLICKIFKCFSEDTFDFLRIVKLINGKGNGKGE